jgi:hypothetical protein
MKQPAVSLQRETGPKAIVKPVPGPNGSQPQNRFGSLTVGEIGAPQILLVACIDGKRWARVGLRGSGWQLVRVNPGNFLDRYG